MSAAPTIEIRPLQADDNAEWRRLWRGYLEFYESEASETVYDTTWARLLSGAEGEYAGLMALSESGGAIGIAHYLFHRHCWKVENVCYLQDLFVAPQARGQGVGEALIRSVYERADAAGAGDVYWLTQHFNQKGRALYDRVGRLTPFIKYSRP